jgi:hypothetical protein
MIRTPGVKGFGLFTIPLLTVVCGFLLVFWTERIAEVVFQAYLIRLTPVVIWFVWLGFLTLILLVSFGYRRKTLQINTRIAISTFQVWISSANLYKLLGISLLLSVLCFGLLFRLLPLYRRWFYAEDQFLENLTAGLFLITFLLSVFILVKNRGGRVTDLIIPAVSLLGFLEDMSYGERHFASIQKIVSKYNIDGLHDFFKLGVEYLQKQGMNPVFYAITGILLISLSLFGVLVAWYFLKKRYETPLINLGPLIFTIICFAFILPSLVLDFVAIGNPASRVIEFVEELLEWFGALALFFGGISIYQRIAYEDRISVNVD